MKDEPEDARQAVIVDLASLNARLGFFDAALKADIQDPNAKEMVLGQVAVQECQNGDREAAEAKLFKMENPLYKIDTHTGMAAALARQKQEFHAQTHFKEALDLIYLLENQREKFERQLNLSLAEFDAGYFEQAFQTVGEISGDLQKAKVLSQMIMRAKEKKVYARIRFMIDLSQDKFVRDELIEQLALAKAKAGFRQEALEDISQLPGSARVRVFCEMALTSWRSQDKQTALNLLLKAADAVNLVKGNIERAGALSSLAAAQAKMDQKKESEISLYKMKSAAMQVEREPAQRALLLIQLAEAQQTNGQPEEALINFYEARNSVSGTPSLDIKTQIFSRIAKGLVLMGRSFEGKEFFSKSRNLINQIGELEKKIDLLVRVAVDEADSKMIEDACSTLQYASSVAAKDPDEEQRAMLLERIALTYVQLKNLDRATDLLDSIHTPLRKGGLLRAILFEVAKNKEENEAVLIAKKQPLRSVVFRGLLGAAFGVLSQEPEI